MTASRYIYVALFATLWLGGCSSSPEIRHSATLSDVMKSAQSGRPVESSRSPVPSPHVASSGAVRSPLQKNESHRDDELVSGDLGIEQLDEDDLPESDWETLSEANWSVVRGQPFMRRSGRFETSESLGLRVAWETRETDISSSGIEFATHLAAGSTGMRRYQDSVERASHIELTFELLGIGELEHGFRYKIGGGVNLGHIWWHYRQYSLDGERDFPRQDSVNYVGFSVPLGLEWQWGRVRAEWFIIPAILLLDEATTEGYENDIRKIQFRTKSNLSVGLVL